MVIPEKLRPTSVNQYLYYRIYCVAAVPVFLWAFLPNSGYAFLIVIPFLPALIMILNLTVFPLKYSILGPNMRTPFPQENQILVQTNSWGGIDGMGAFGGFGARQNMSLAMTMYIFSSGVGISFFGNNKVFIPKENICSLESNGLMGYKLTHNSPELRNPVVFSSKEIYEKMQAVFFGK